VAGHHLSDAANSELSIAPEYIDILRRACVYLTRGWSRKHKELEEKQQVSARGVFAKGKSQGQKTPGRS
jgi:hypothetical protein